MKDHHVDRPGVYVRQRTQLTGPNRPIGSIHKASPSKAKACHHVQQSSTPHRRHLRRYVGATCIDRDETRTSTHACTHITRREDASRHPEPARTRAAQKAARVHWTTWWLWRGDCTRSHPELGRENPQRPWYCVSRRGRVGRRQVFQCTQSSHHPRGVEQPGSSSGS